MSILQIVAVREVLLYKGLLEMNPVVRHIGKEGSKVGKMLMMAGKLFVRVKN
jgi:hypothetical protein